MIAELYEQLAQAVAVQLEREEININENQEGDFAFFTESLNQYAELTPVAERLQVELDKYQLQEAQFPLFEDAEFILEIFYYFKDEFQAEIGEKLERFK